MTTLNYLEKEPSITIQDYLNESISNNNKLTKMGYAYGLSGIVKGIGIILVDKNNEDNILTFIHNKINNKKFKNDRYDLLFL